MTTLELRQVWSNDLQGASLQLAEAGLHVLLGAPTEGSTDVVPLVAGIRRPRSGSVRVFSADPYRSPEARSATASVLPEESLGAQGSVERVLARGLRASSSPSSAKSARELLERFELSDWAERPLRELSPREHRTLAATLALTYASARLHVWHEPLADLPRLDTSLVRESLQRASQQALVVVTTASVADALELGGQVHLLERGRIVRQVPAAGGAMWLAPGNRQTLVVHSPQARQLAALALRDPRVAGSRVDVETPAVVRLNGDSLPELAAALTELVAREPSLHIDQLGPEAVSLEETAASSSALARAAYDAAYAEAFDRARQAQAVPQAPPPYVAPEPAPTPAPTPGVVEPSKPEVP